MRPEGPNTQTFVGAYILFDTVDSVKTMDGAYLDVAPSTEGAQEP